MFALIVARNAQVLVGKTKNKTFSRGEPASYLDEQHGEFRGVHDKGPRKQYNTHENR